MFHVELRRFPHVSRTFNLTREQLDERVVRPWVAGAAFELDERRWEPARTRLAIYEGPALAPEDLGMGRGWANATRTAQEVTAQVLEAARASLDRFKAELLGHDRLSLAEVVELAGRAHPQARLSDRIALAERSVWELLHEGRLTLRAGASVLEAERWEPVLLSWAAWSDDSVGVQRPE